MRCHRTLQVDGLVHHSLTCPVCGDSPCTIELPVLPTWSFALPPCPLTPELLAGQWKGKLPDISPVPRLISAIHGTVVEGTATLKKRKGIGDDEVLMTLEGNLHLQ